MAAKLSEKRLITHLTNIYILAGRMVFPAGEMRLAIYLFKNKL
jgi:hypothetical protein